MRLYRYILLLAIAIASVAYAETSQEKGLQIAKETDARNQGFADTSVEMTMELRNRNGDSSIRQMRTMTLEVADDGDKSMTIFDSPADVRGTAMLTFTHKTGNDDQWLYLPALKRVKRISSSNKSGPFMGSEFAYEDLGSQEVEKYSYNWIRDEELNGIACFVVERTPVYDKSGYTRMMTWINKETYQPVQIEFYDRRNSHLKTLQMEEYKLYSGKFWRPQKLTMVNHQNGKSSILSFSEYTFGSGLDSNDFTENSLKRMR